MTREPSSIGFYPFEGEELRAKIRSLLDETPGNNSETPKGLLVPHAGYRFSGETAAHAYKTLVNSKFKKALLLGVNHTGMGSKAGLSTQDWETPLGTLEKNEELNEKLLKNSVIEEDDRSHLEEHSIEVQLPFLKYILPDISVSALSLRSDLDKEEVLSISGTIKGVISEDEEIILIASSDLNHIGPRFRVNPSVDTVKYLSKKDDEIIDVIKDMDMDKMLEKGRESTVCGFIPISILIESLRDKEREVRVLDRSSSYEVTGDRSNVVGYASLGFY